MAKVGRKAKHWRDPDTGMVYNGLGRRPSKNGTPGRFYAINDRNKTFGADPKIAIAKFQAYKRATRGERPLLVCGMDKVVRDIGGNGTVLCGNNGNGTVHVPDRETLTRILKVGDDFQRVPDALKPMIMGLQAHEEYWPQYAEERGLNPELPFEGYWPDYIYWLFGRWIKAEPDDAAQKLGIPQLKNLDAIKPPKPSLRLSEVVEIYREKPDVGQCVRRRQIRWFEEFARVVGVRSIKQIEAKHIESYRKKIFDECAAKGCAPCWIQGRFTKVRTLLAYAAKRGRDQDELNRVLGLCKMLEAPRYLVSKGSRPITRDELAAFLAVADIRETAIILLALNCAFYPIDICRIPEVAVDLDKGHVDFPRTKVGKPIPRVAMLWERTIAALRIYREQLPHSAADGDGEKMLFANTKGSRLKSSTFMLTWKYLRRRTPMPHVQFRHLRDGAYTAGVEAGIDITQCEILMGHSVGASKDAYIGYRPQIVAEACAAIEKHYFD